MVLGGSHQKPRTKSISEVLARAYFKMAVPPFSHARLPRSPKLKPLTIGKEGESDAELLATPLSSKSSPSQPDLLRQIKCMLQKALKQTADQNT